MNTPLAPGWCRALAALVGLTVAATVSAQVEFHVIGDLPGSVVHSEVRDAVILPDGSILAVGTAARFGTQGDTPIKWTVAGGIVQLSNDFPANGSPAFITARAVSPDGSIIVGSARNDAVGNNRGPAYWSGGGTSLTRLGFLGGTPTLFPNVGLNCISADGTVAYGFTRGPGNSTVAIRYTTAGGMQSIGFLNPTDVANFPALHSVSADGTTLVGNSSNGTNLPNNGLIAYRYVYTGVGPTGGSMTALPAVSGGNWTFALGITPDGTRMLGLSGAGAATGEVVIWHSGGTTDSLGTPPGITGFSAFGGISSDGETVVVGTDLGIFLHNPSGWFNIQTLLTEAGIDLTGWTLLLPLGMSSDARLIYGVGTRTNGDQEGFILKLPPDFIKGVGDTTPPVLSVPADMVVEATSAAGATVNFTATAEDAVDGSVPVLCSQSPGTVFPLGTTVVTVSATDGSGNVATGSFTITVRDTTAPSITGLTVSQAVLWPPNHKMVNVAVSASATDVVGPVTFRITGITSSEPDNGLGDGDTSNDTAILGPMLASLRAERSGNGPGRVYTIMVEASDAAGNTSTGTVTVSVPKK